MNTPPLERARRSKARRISSIWLVPVVALAIGVWMAYDTVTSRGPLITLDMRYAEGVEAGKTLVKVSDVPVGRVESVGLSDDFSYVQVAVRMYEGTDAMLTEETRFWLVRPRIGRDGISGLGTLLSGAYIEMLPGDGEAGVREFQVLAQPPVLRGNENGVRVKLVSDQGNQLSAGDPVTFRGYTVGRIESAEFTIDDQKNVFQVFIEEPFSQLVTDDVRFWQNSGISLQFGAEGVRVDIGSMESLLVGGITFDVLSDVRYGRPITDGTEFTLYKDRDSAQQEGFTLYSDFLMLAQDSVRGLTSGAPVEFRGIRVGTVIQVPYTGGSGLGRSLIEGHVPVHIRIEPERLGPEFAGLDMERWNQQLESMFERGLRATLGSASLLTGALYVDLVFDDSEISEYQDYTASYPLFPVVGGGNRLDRKIGDLVDNLNSIDFAALSHEAGQTLQGLTELSQQLAVILQDPDTRELPQSLRRTLDELGTTLSGYSADAPAYHELTRAMERLNRILSDLEPFAETLRERPNSLLFNPPAVADPEPRRQP